MKTPTNARLPTGPGPRAGIFCCFLSAIGISAHAEFVPQIEVKVKAVSVAISNSGQFTATGDAKGRVALWRTADAQLVRELKGHHGAVLAVVISADDRILASAGNDGTVRVWDFSTGSLLQVLKGHTDRVNALAISRNGEFLASGSHDDTVRVWRLADGATFHRLTGHNGPVRAVAFSPAGNLLASSGEDGVIQLWSVQDGRVSKTLKRGLFDLQYALSFSPTGEFLASSNNRERIQFWHLPDGTMVKEITALDSPVRSLCYSQTGDYLVSVGGGEVKLWRATDGSLVQAFVGHTGTVNGAACSATDEFAGTVGSDGTLRFWRLPPPPGALLPPSSERAASVPFARAPSSSDISVNLPRGEENPKAVAVVIGTHRYLHADIPPADFAIDDAKLMREYLKTTLGYRKENIIFLENPTKGALERVFGTQENPAGELGNYLEGGDSDVFVYYAGHGVPELSSKSAYLAPSDFSPDFVQLTGYPLSLLDKNLGLLSARTVTLVIDACFSGMTPAGPILKSASPIVVQEIAPGSSGRITSLTASGGDQIASWYPEKGHALFTYFFLKALQGYANRDNDRVLLFSEIADYLEQNVPRHAKKLFNRTQTPKLHGEKTRPLVTYR